MPICTCAGEQAQGDVKGEWAMATVLPKLVGDRIKRREDPALIQGLGRYVDDVPTVGTLHAAFFRSPYAHARIKSLNVEAAKNSPGVVTVLTGADLLGKVGDRKSTTSELQSQSNLVCRLLLEKKKNKSHIRFFLLVMSDDCENTDV